MRPPWCWFRRLPVTLPRGADVPDLDAARRELDAAQRRTVGAERRAQLAGRFEGALPRAVERLGDAVEHALASIAPPAPPQPPNPGGRG